MRLRHGPTGDAGGLHVRPPARGARGGDRGARRLLLGLTLAGALLAASACEVGVGVDIDVAENGSGTVAVGVSFDRAASDALGDLASQLDLQDLALAGWDVTGPARETDNLLWVRATKRFGSAEELPAVLAEIAGPDVFEGFQMRRRSEFAEQTWEFAGKVDPAAALPELFDTLAFNEGLQERIRAAIGDFGGGLPLDGLTVRLSIDLPGSLTSGAGDFTWTSLSEDSPPVAVRMTAQEENTTAKTLRLVGLAAAALFVLAMLLNVLGWWYVRRYRKRRASALMAKADSEQIPAVATGAVDAPAEDAVSTDDSWGSVETAGADLDWLEQPVEAAGAVAVGDDDWDDFTSSEYEDLAGDLEDLPDDLDDLAGDLEEEDLTAAGTAASAGDWTASLEGSRDAAPEPDAAASTGEETAAPLDETGSLHEPAEVDESEELVGPEAGDDADQGEPEEVDELPPGIEPEAVDEPDVDGEPDAEDQTDTDDAPETDDETDSSDEPDEDGEPDVATAPAATAAATPTPPSRTLRLVVIGGWGVLFQPADPAGELLVPYLQQAGATASPAAIRESYRLATLGRLTPDELWESCGLTGEPTWTHGPYTGQMSVSAGAADFVRSLLRRHIGVACVTNDVSDWSWRLRAWTGFEALSPWVVSSDIGIRKPDPGVFEMLRRVAEIPFASCLVIDNDVRTLDAARSLGMSTGLFGVPVDDAAGARGSHPAVGDFTDLLRRT
ncbi:MAG: hypothetical protein J4F44_02785 [Acidimicrobiia bacterium]|nr:hypothetical protein [Acidimicrobiia bacterium]